MNKEKNSLLPQRLDRRAAIKWMLAATASLPLMDTESFAQSGPSIPTPNGIGSDPNMLDPGRVPWERCFTAEQLRTAAALSEVILPKGEGFAGAIELHVPDFIDEWISAPYAPQKKDRKRVLNGLKWINEEARKRFGDPFHKLERSHQTEICDDICNLATAKSEYKEGANYFAKFRDLTMAGYYTSDIGAREVGYVGNVALPAFKGPPQKVLDYLGLEKAPW